MKKIIKEKITPQTFYISEDGREFDNMHDCETYENFMGKSIYDVLKEYITFLDDKTPLEMKNNIISEFIYIIVNKPIPSNIKKYIEIIEKGSGKSSIPLTPQCIEYPTLFYNDWSGAYNGGCCYGWKNIGSQEQLEKDVKYFSSMLEKFFSKNYWQIIKLVI